MIRFSYGNLPPHECNRQLSIVLDWLVTNVGRRWNDWDFGSSYGTVIIEDEELALIFKLKFGI